MNLPNTFQKIHNSPLKNEWLRVVNLFDAAQSSQAFRAPKPLQMQEETQSILYERLPPGKTLYQTLSDHILPNDDDAQKANHAQLYYRIGKALHQLHQQFPNNTGKAAKLGALNSLPTSLSNHATTVINHSKHRGFHGDFCPGNIWIPNNDSDIWFLDPIPSHFFPDPTAHTISIYWDLSHFASALFFAHPLILYKRTDQEEIFRLMKHVFQGYENDCSQPLDHATLWALTIEVFHRFIESQQQQGIVFKRLLKQFNAKPGLSALEQASMEALT